MSTETTKTQKVQLVWKDIYRVMTSDNGHRWYPNDPVVSEYLQTHAIRSPSRTYPNSFAKAVMTKKFAKWAVANHPVWAASLGLDVGDLSTKSAKDVNGFVFNLIGELISKPEQPSLQLLQDTADTLTAMNEHISSSRVRELIMQEEVEQTEAPMVVPTDIQLSQQSQGLV